VTSKRKQHKQLNRDIKQYRQVIREGRKSDRVNYSDMKEAKKDKRAAVKNRKTVKKGKHKVLKMLTFRNKLMFSLLKGVFNGIWFIVLYFAYIKNLPRMPFIWDGAIGLGYTAIGISVTRLISWGIAFAITEHSNLEKNVQFFMRSVLVTMTISVLLFTEVFFTLYNNLDVKYSVGGYVLLQFLVFTLADFLVDNFLFQH